MAGKVEKFTDEERQLLTECARRMAEVAATEPPPAWATWDRRDFDLLREFGPRYSPGEWFPSDQVMPEKYRQRYLRAVHRLAARGLLTMGQVGGRLAHVRLTPAGERAAAGLAKKAAAKKKNKE